MLLRCLLGHSCLLVSRPRLVPEQGADAGTFVELPRVAFADRRDAVADGSDLVVDDGVGSAGAPLGSNTTAESIVPTVSWACVPVGPSGSVTSPSTVSVGGTVGFSRNHQPWLRRMSMLLVISAHDGLSWAVVRLSTSTPSPASFASHEAMSSRTSRS